GTPMTKLHDVLVPIYLFHRYQLEGTVKLIGGLDYTYKIKGDNQPTPEIVDKRTQERALAEMLKAIDPEVLALPENVLELIPTRPPGMPSTRELFNGNTGPAMDALGIAQTAANVPLSLILNPARANRLVEYHARENNLSLEKVIDEIIENTWEARYGDDYHDAIQKVVNHLVVVNLINLHASDQANPLTKAIVFGKLSNLMEALEEQDNDPVALQAAMMIDSYLDDPEEFEAPGSLSPPPGSPIGSGEFHLYCTH
ncbi:MAG: zinc-dependent metalloprotease, partial [Balneolaceae bacterium]